MSNSCRKSTTFNNPILSRVIGEFNPDIFNVARFSYRFFPYNLTIQLRYFNFAVTRRKAWGSLKELCACLIRYNKCPKNQTLTASYEKKECVRSFIITNNFVLNVPFDYLFALNYAEDEAVSQVNKSIGFRLAPNLFSDRRKKRVRIKGTLNQFVIFNPWKNPWNWIACYQNCFVISPGLLYHLIRRDSGRLSNEDFTPNPIVSSNQWFNGLKITNWNIPVDILLLLLLLHMKIFCTL